MCVWGGGQGTSSYDSLEMSTNVKQGGAHLLGLTFVSLSPYLPGPLCTFQSVSIGPVSYDLRNFSVSNTVLESPGKSPG